MALFNWLGSKHVYKPMRLDQAVRALISEAEAFGLPKQDVTNAYSMLENREYECAFEIVVQQLHESGIKVNATYYELLKTAAEKMLLPKQNFLFVKELIK